MYLKFSAVSASLQLTSDMGTSVTFALTLKPASDAFELRSGLSFRDSSFICTVHPESQCPYADKFAVDGRIGEISPLMASPSKEHNVYMLSLQVPDSQFDALLFEVSRQNLPTDIMLEVREDKDSSHVLADGVYNDEIAGLLKSNANLAMRSFVFTMELIKAKA